MNPAQVSDLLTDPEYINLVNKIDAEVDYIDYKPYSHNIIGLCLQQVAEKFGNKAANDLIEEFDLESQGWSKVLIDEDI